jgi:hypothetical protein
MSVSSRATATHTLLGCTPRPSSTANRLVSLSRYQVRPRASRTEHTESSQHISTELAAKRMAISISKSVSRPLRRGSPCLISEAPDSDEIADADLKALAMQVRDQLGTLPKGIFTCKAKPVAVTVTGQLFLDAHHIGKGDPGGGRGANHCATTAWEIHPITGIQFTAPN